ncbi:MAG: hypothetical protein H7339_15075 [Arcicella sp.]|nr:hypothetical protein [Arcicella sp.]
MSIIEGYVNGSTGIVMSLSKGVVEVKFDHNNRIFPVSAAEWKRGGSEKFVFATATQIPLSLAFASNYHKIQGSTIHVPVYMDLANCFTYHQVYTAVSRVKKLENLHLLSFDPKKITVHQTVKKYYN